MMTSYLAEIVGWATMIIILAKVTYNLCHFAFTVFLGPAFGLNIDVKKCGPWAVVTGATDGIGKSYAKAFAQAGLNVVLVSRSAEKLNKVAKEIGAINSGIEIKTIDVDFTHGKSIYPVLKAELSQLEVGILVNNVGMLVGIGQSFASIENEMKIHDIINCNVMSMARMCHLVLPQMIQRRKGVVINIGSIACAMTTPFLTVYGATKAFVDKFSQDLAAEVRGHGVLVQTVHPGHVRTNMTAPMDAGEPSITGPESDKFVRSALGTLGLENRTGGYWFHKYQLAMGDFLDSFFPRNVMENLVMKRFSSFERSLKKFGKLQ